GRPAVEHLHQSLKAVTHFRARRAQNNWLAKVDRADRVPKIVRYGPGDLQTQSPLHFLGVDVVPLARRSIHDDLDMVGVDAHSPHRPEESLGVARAGDI